MLGSLLNSSTDEFNEIHSYSDASFEDLFQIIPLKENDDLGDVYPFSPCKTQKIIKKEMFETFRAKKNSRKDKEDDIRKKFKSSFHRNLTNIINAKLKKVCPNYLLNSLPQNFITDVTKKTNYEVMDLTYEELFEYTHNRLINDDKNKKRKKYIEKRNKAAKKKCEKNKKLLDYLRTNKKISEESGWETIKKMKYIDLLKAYLNSNEFQNYINKQFKKEQVNYRKNFIYFASTFIEHYLTYKPKKNISHKKNNPHSEDPNNTPGLNQPIIMPFPPSIFDVTESDNNMLGSLDESINYLEDSSNTNTLFINGDSLLEREDYL